MDRSLVQVKQGRLIVEAGTHSLREDTFVLSLANVMVRSFAYRSVVRRSLGCVRPWRAGTTKPHAGYVGCISRVGVYDSPARRGSADPIAGPMTLVRRNSRSGTADALRDRLHGRPLVDRATTNNGLRRSFTR